MHLLNRLLIFRRKKNRGGLFWGEAPSWKEPAHKTGLEDFSSKTQREGDGAGHLFANAPCCVGGSKAGWVGVIPSFFPFK